MKTKTSFACLLLPSLAAFLPAQGYEWDHPDGIGVRYLLYKKMKEREVKPDYEGPDIRLAYTPTDEGDWVRIKGYPMDWGVLVYEFGKSGAEESAESFEDFLVHKDRYLKTHRREIRVHGEPIGDGPVRLWEYRDRWIPNVYVLEKKRAPGGKVWAESDQWKIRFPVAKDMVAWNPNENMLRASGPNLRARLRAHTNDWVRLKGYKRAQAWWIDVYEFPEGGEPDDSRLWAEDFEQLVTRKEKQTRRTFSVQGEEQKGKSLPFRFWQWTDDHRKGGKGLVRHNLAAVYDLPGREIALVMRYPNEDEEPDRKLHRLGAAMVSGLIEYPDAKPDDTVGSEYYYLAASCKVQDEEVAVVVNIPVETGGNPDPALRARAETIVKSLQPQK